MRYLPELDGLRALAVLAVVCVHAHVLPGGFIGVDVFFVLSGYLITQVLAANPDLPRFYWRRAKRLIPALAFMLAAYLIVAPLVVPGYPHARDAGLAFFYLSDYAVAFWEMPHYLGHTWSLAVEEHFYMLWPLAFLWLRPSVRWLLVAYAMATFWRWVPDQVNEYARFDTRLSGLLLGCALAQVPRSRMPAWIGLVALAALCLANPFSMSQPAEAVALMGVELAAAVAIVGRPPAWLSHRWLVYLGRLSYGIYLWHFPIALILAERYWSWQGIVLVTVPLSIACAALSYHTVEAWARGLKYRAGTRAPCHETVPATPLRPEPAQMET